MTARLSGLPRSAPCGRILRPAASAVSAGSTGPVRGACAQNMADLNSGQKWGGADCGAIDDNRT